MSMKQTYTTITKLCQAHPILKEDVVQKNIIDADINGLMDMDAVRNGVVSTKGQVCWANDKNVCIKTMINAERYFDWMYKKTRELLWKKV